MKTPKTLTQSQTDMLLALRQVADLARELCRPDFSEVDNAIGRYVLDTVQPLLGEPVTKPLKPRFRRPNLARLLGRRRDEGGKQRASVIGSGQPLNVSAYAPNGDAGGAADSRYEIVGPEMYVSIN